MNVAALPLPPLAGEPWPAYLDRANRALLDRGYARSSRRLYRQVPRGVAAWLRRHNRAAEHSALTGADVFAYIAHIANRRGSWSWLAMNISVLRMLFDEFGGRQITVGLLTPRRNWPLPEVLSEDEIARLLTAGGTLRDQLLLGLLYGCGLKPGEVENLHWSDIAEEAETLRATGRHGPRTIPIPERLRALLLEGRRRCPPQSPLFVGGRAGKPLTVRTMERIVRTAARDAGIDKCVSAMILRHSQAVHALEARENIRAIQIRLGHRSVKTTMIYLRCLVTNTQSPLDRLRQV